MRMPHTLPRTNIWMCSLFFARMSGGSAEVLTSAYGFHEVAIFGP